MKWKVIAEPSKRAMRYGASNKPYCTWGIETRAEAQAEAKIQRARRVYGRVHVEQDTEAL